MCLEENKAIASAAFKNEERRVTYAYRMLQNGPVLDSGTCGLTIVKSSKSVFDGAAATAPNP